jgi:hypothetical protein
MNIRVVQHPDIQWMQTRMLQTSKAPRERPADGMPSATPPGSRPWRTAWRTAIRPVVTRSDRWLEGGRPLRPPIGVVVSWPTDGLAAVEWRTACCPPDVHGIVGYVRTRDNPASVGPRLDDVCFWLGKDHLTAAISLVRSVHVECFVKIKCLVLNKCQLVMVGYWPELGIWTA